MKTVTMKNVTAPRLARAACMHAEGPQHDCAYVEWRDALIASAERHADKVCGDKPASREELRRWSTHWDHEFHREMRRLTEDPFARASMQMMTVTHAATPRSSEVH